MARFPRIFLWVWERAEDLRFINPDEVGLAILATVRETLGSLDKVKRLIKTLGMVNATPDFKDQPMVINGFSEFMAQVFGDDAGVGARSAVGMGSLPGEIPVEIECIFEVA